jgi:DNA-directed RNA polymerase specialized sigma24 family protein
MPHQALVRSIGTLPLRDRCILRLFLNKGASHSELAGILGTSRRRVGDILRRLLSVASDPRRLSLVNAWRRLSPEEQRLAYLHLILEMPLSEISRMGLMRRKEADGTAVPAISRGLLARQLRQIMRKVQRITAAAAATRPDR